MNRVKTLALGLDAPGAGNGNIYTVFLRNAEAVRIAETLRGLLSGSESSRTTTHRDHARPATPPRRPRATAPAAARRSRRRAELGDPGLPADQLDHHHRVRAGVPRRCAP